MISPSLRVLDERVPIKSLTLPKFAGRSCKNPSEIWKTEPKHPGFYETRPSSPASCTMAVNAAVFGNTCAVFEKGVRGPNAGNAISQ